MNESGTGFWSELRRRRVLPVAGAYLVIGWLVTEVAGFLLEQAAAPGGASRLLAIVFVVGFPVTVALAWIIQRRPDGHWSLDSSKGQARAVLTTVVLGVLATVGLAWLILPRVEDAPAVPAYLPLPNSIAILPFVDADSTPNERTVAETLYTALLQGLNEAPELTQVRLRLKERPEELLDFGRRMRVVALLGGHIRQVPGGTRIEMELLDVGLDRKIWSYSLDWDSTRIMETGTAIANGVLKTMGLPPSSLKKFAGTDDREAYDALLLGHRRFASFRVEDLAAAIEEFQRAIEMDPGYVRAYTALGTALRAYRNIKGPPEPERQALEERARKALETAVKLDAESADAVSALSLLTPNPEVRAQLLERALELDPNHQQSYHRLAYLLWDEGELEEAERLFRKALELDPMDANSRSDLGDVLWELGQTGDAVAELNRSLELEPGMAQSHRLLGLIEVFSFGRIENSIFHGRKAYALDPQDGGLAGFLAASYAGLGAEEEALAWIERSLELGPTSAWTLNMAYLTHHMLGDEVRALEYAKRMHELHPGNQFALFYLGARDIEAGRAHLAFERWEGAHPAITADDDPVCDLSNYNVLVPYADNMIQAGKLERGRQVLHNCLPVIAQMSSRLDPESQESRILALLGRKEDALNALRREIMHDHRRIEASFRFARPEYDLLRDEPEFQQLMQMVNTDLREQLERIRAMERNGDLPPAPGVVLIER